MRDSKTFTEHLRLVKPWPDAPFLEVGAVLRLTNVLAYGQSALVLISPHELPLIAEFYAAVRSTTLAIGAGIMVVVPEPVIPFTAEDVVRALAAAETPGEPSAGYMLSWDAEKRGTTMFPAWWAMRQKLKNNWPKACKQCGESFRPERRNLVRCECCRAADR
jgi:hypothetical protein